MTSLLTDKIGSMPAVPGVYIMKDAEGRNIYVGKARNLKRRLASYFSRTEHRDLKTGMLLKRAADVEFIITGTEKEALILESNLIKKYRPRYNVILKDDKRYPSLKIDPRVDFPNIRIVRKIKNDGGLYFGPFSSSHAVKETLKVIHKTFKIRKCKSEQVKHRERPCLNYQMNACMAPCSQAVSRKAYQGMVNEIVLFLKGRGPDLIRKIKSEMSAAAAAQDFEKAAELRDKMFALEKTLEKQVVVSSDFMDRDVFGLAADDVSAAVTLLTVRNGFLRGARSFQFQETMSSDTEVMESLIKQYYEKSHFLPKEILLSVEMPTAGILEDLIGSAGQNRIHIKHPVRGEKKRLVEMAVQNAKTVLADMRSSAAALAELLARLQSKVSMRRFPARIECLDNSHISGSSAVAGLVVFENGKPKKSAYRKYHAHNIETSDDYETMREILRRRFSKHANGSASPADSPLPDLLVVDGGKGQLNIAIDVLNALGMTDRFDVIAIAKKDDTKDGDTDKVYLPFRANAVQFGKDRDALHFLQLVRDEAHRFAISFHRRTRSGNFFLSALDGIPGVGEKRKRSLLKHFKSLEKIRAASRRELHDVPGMNGKAAESVYHALHKGGAS